MNTISLTISDKLTVLIPFPTPFFHPSFFLGDYTLSPASPSPLPASVLGAIQRSLPANLLLHSLLGCPTSHLLLHSLCEETGIGKEAGETLWEGRQREAAGSQLVAGKIGLNFSPTRPEQPIARWSCPAVTIHFPDIKGVACYILHCFFKKE